MIGIVGFANLRIMQYLNKYTDILDKNNIEYEVIYWNRDGGTEEKTFKGRTICYEYNMNSYQAFQKKIAGFVKYTKFMLKTIKERKYDKLIVLTSQTAIPLYRLLLKKYNGRYIFDYRDITKEHLGFYKKMVKNLVENSYITPLSSFGFQKIIGESDKHIVSHNCSNLKIQEIAHKTGEKINISFWGLIRHAELNKKICDAFGKDQRFNLFYHGDGFYHELKKYCEEKSYDNVVFTGRYNRDEILGFAENANIVHCVYSNNWITKNTLAVKLYDAIRYEKPIMVMKNSYLSEYLDGYDFKFDFQYSDNIAEEVYNWYMTLDRDKYGEQYKIICEKVNQDDKLFEEKVLKFTEITSND